MNDASPKRGRVVSMDEFRLPGGSFPELLSARPFEAEATCIRMRRFWCFQRTTIQLEFRIFEPHEFEGKSVFWYAPWRKKWTKGPPPSSKIAKATVIATGTRRNRHISPSTFVGKAFQIVVRPTKGDVPYSVVDGIFRKLGGGDG